MPVVNTTRSASGTRRTHSVSTTAGADSSNTSSQKLSWIDTRSGASNPEWKRQIRAGVNATTSYVCTLRDDKPIKLRASARINKIGVPPGGHYSLEEYDLDGFLTTSIFDPLDYSDSEAEKAARQRFVERYRKARTKFQSGVFFGELAQTVEMIKSPAKALREGIDRYFGDVKKRLRRSRNPKRTVRDTWLEYVFGWAPLINDVADACKLATADPYRVYEKFTGKAIRDMEKLIINDSYTQGILKVNFKQIHTMTITVKYKGAIKAENHPPSFPEQLGLSWSNFAPTIWELVPYSFLIDYFTNVGNVIEGISTGTINLAWGCRVSHRQSSASIGAVELDQGYLDSFTSSQPKWTTSGHATGGGLNSTRLQLLRTPVSAISVGIGDLGFHLPGSPWKWLNIAALARLGR